MFYMEPSKNMSCRGQYHILAIYLFFLLILLPLFRSDCLGTLFGLLVTDLTEDVNAPACGDVESLVPVKLVEGLEFRVGDDEVYRQKSVSFQQEENRDFDILIVYFGVSTYLGSCSRYETG